MISKWFTTEVAVSHTLASIPLPSMSVENVVQRPGSDLTRSQFGPINWNVCIFCNNKTYQHFKTLRKIESIERISRILDAQNHYSDSNIIHKTSQEHFKERAKSKEPTDDQLLHSIAKIIRNDIAKVEFSTEHDPTLTDASPSHSFHPMPNSLIKLLNWVKNDKALNAGDNTPEMQTDGLIKC